MIGSLVRLGIILDFGVLVKSKFCLVVVIFLSWLVMKEISLRFFFYVILGWVLLKYFGNCLNKLLRIRFYVVYKVWLEIEDGMFGIDLGVILNVLRIFCESKNLFVILLIILFDFLNNFWYFDLLSVC